MSKYIKVLVSDDFDANTHKLICEQPNDNSPVKNYCKIWEPQYREVLDKGFIGLVDFMGDDSTVIDAARVSYGKGTKRVSEDRHLIRYLMRHAHSTPFEMIEMMWHIKLPIFVARQWIRHRTANVNEYSGRYSVMNNDIYMPKREDCKPQSKDNKQGRSGVMSEQNAYACQLQLEHVYKESEQAYHYLLGDTNTPSASLEQRRIIATEFAIHQIKLLEKNNPDWKPELVTEEMVNNKINEVLYAHGIVFTDDEFSNNEGLARELARIGLPLANYTEMYWKCDLKNTMNFLSLRLDEHAQYEIREYAKQMYNMIKPLAPICMEAFADYQLEGISLSRMEIDLLRDMYRDTEQYNDTSITKYMKTEGASNREISEFLNKLKG